MANLLVASTVVSSVITSTPTNDMFSEKIKLKNARRDAVAYSYASAKADNDIKYMEGDSHATSEYIYPNQKKDAKNVVDMMHDDNRRVVSIQKKTKVGADGLIIEISVLATTHPDDNFVINKENVRIITGMSNVKWAEDMMKKVPTCFREHVFHHGKLTKSDLKNIHDSIIIIDEIDTGDKEGQRLETVLKDAGVLNVQYMEQKNIRFVFISATCIKQLHELYKWGEFHKSYTMTIPESYIGHKEFLEKGIIQEFYPLNTKENAEK